MGDLEQLWEQLPRSRRNLFASRLVDLVLPGTQVVRISDPIPRDSPSFQAIVKTNGFRVHSVSFPPVFLWEDRCSLALLLFCAQLVFGSVPGTVFTSSRWVRYNGAGAYVRSLKTIRQTKEMNKVW